MRLTGRDFAPILKGMTTWFKRISLFLLVNFLVMASISILVKVLGFDHYTRAYGLDLPQLAVFCLFWGMGGSLISLMISRFMAKTMMGVKVIDPRTMDPGLQWLVETVHHLARSANLPAMPEVGIYESPEINAFATGPSKSRSLVAVSTGILQRMRREELEGVLGHEISHIANGDMVTLTLIQGIVNAFVMFAARVIAFAITSSGRDSDREERGGVSGSYYLVSFVLEMVFMIFGSMVVAWFSRWREFRADAGGARLAGRSQMVHALQRLQQNSLINEQVGEPHPTMAAFKISSQGHRFLALFSSHPPLETRIARLEAGSF